MRSSLAVLAALGALSIAPGWAQTPANGVPYIRLDKSVYATNEAVFFWVGVQKIGNDPIPQKYWNTCDLTVTRPDGTQKDIRPMWPIDGPVGEGWTGGCGLGEQAKPGRYLLEFSFAGQKTASTPLTVKDFPILRKIHAEFIYGPSVQSPAGPDTPVTLTVHNNTDRTIRFPHRDGMNGLVSVSLSRPDHSYTNDSFYPAEKLLDQDEQKMPDHGFEEFRWKDARELPTITLKPGETYRQRLSLHTVVADRNKEAASGVGLFVPPGLYTVTFSTTLQVLVGEEGDHDATVSPVHIPVFSTAACTVTH